MIHPVVTSQGKTIIETADGGFQIMHPDGSVRVPISKADAEKCAKDWYRKALGHGVKVGLGEIEWR
jgi:hypothetical protein